MPKTGSAAARWDWTDGRPTRAKNTVPRATPMVPANYWTALRVPAPVPGHLPGGLRRAPSDLDTLRVS